MGEQQHEAHTKKPHVSPLAYGLRIWALDAFRYWRVACDGGV